MPFLSISILQDKFNWQRILNLKNQLTIDDYFHLLEKIRLDEKELKNNFQRIQMIYSQILTQISSWSLMEQRTIRFRASQIYLLAENNQWKVANS